MSTPVGQFFIKLNIGIWLVWVVSWMLASVWRTRSSVARPRREYRFFFVIVMTGMLFSFGGWPVGARHLWPVGPVVGWFTVGLAIAGMAFAWWARIGLGRMWSGGIERTEDHRLVETGAFAIVRHPIYTGMIAMDLAVAIAVATPWSIGGALLFALGFVLKARAEEEFLDSEIGGYEAYRRRVPMLIPLAGPWK